MSGVPRPNEELTQEDIEKETFNVIKVFGAHKVQTVRQFSSLITKHGVPTRGIQKITRGGYKSPLFDSRHFKIRFGSSESASLVHKALINAEKYVLSMAQWRHTQSWEAQLSQNRFAPLREELELCTEWETSELVNVCCWNINTLNGKEALILQYVRKHSIHILAVGETKCKDRMFNHSLSDHTWYGRPACRTAGGVGFLVENSVVSGSKVACSDGKTQDTLFLRITPQRSRTTLYMLVYGIASPTKPVSKHQWESYRRDLRRELKKCPPDTDVVFLGDINARMGRAQNEVELEHISSLGENTRSVSGSEALSFLEEMSLICLNDRDSDQETPNYTYREIGKDGKSIIDVICVSKGMYRAHYAATVLPDTLTGRENHFPVLARLKRFRKLPRRRKQPTQHVWATRLLQSKQKLTNFQVLTDEYLQMNQIDEFTCPDIAASILENALKSAAKQSIGKIRVGGRPHKSRIEEQIESKQKELRAYRSRHKDDLARSSTEHRREEKALLESLQELRGKAISQSNRHLSKKLSRQH